MEADVPEEGMTYEPNTLESTRIGETAKYNGVRLTFRGFLGTARVPMQIDIGFGDPVVPGPIRNTYPQRLDYGSPRLLGYMIESAIADPRRAAPTLTDAFFHRDPKRRQWRAFLRNIRAGSPPALPDVISDFAAFLQRPSHTARYQNRRGDEGTADASWPPGGPWS